MEIVVVSGRGAAYERNHRARTGHDAVTVQPAVLGVDEELNG